MRFRFIDGRRRNSRPASTLGPRRQASGYLAWKERPACRRQRDDMVLLAHVRSAFTLFEREPTAARAWCTNFATMG